MTARPFDDGLPPPPRNLRITLEYDGQGYVGWERQKNGVSIQETVEAAIERITGERTLVHGSGRTDAGVHALAQVANFTLRHLIPASDLVRALNAVLPPDVAVLEGADVPLTFHARFSACGKTYRYDVHNSKRRTALERRRTHHVRATLDLEAMRAAARFLVGRHDFTSFTKDAGLATSCVREVTGLEIVRHGSTLSFSVTGEGFLYNMVRIIVGTLIHVGLGKMPAEAIRGILAGKNRNLAGPTVPACALFLVEVFYEGGSDDAVQRLRNLLTDPETSVIDSGVPSVG